MSLVRLLLLAFKKLKVRLTVMRYLKTRNKRLTMAWLQRAAISAKPWGLGGAARNLNKLKCKKKSKRKVSQIRFKNQKVKASWTTKRSRHRKLVKRGF